MLYKHLNHNILLDILLYRSKNHYNTLPSKASIYRSTEKETPLYPTKYKKGSKQKCFEPFLFGNVAKTIY